MPKPKAAMMGQITVANDGEQPDSHPFRLVIDFPDAASLRKALAEESVQFTFGDTP